MSLCQASIGPSPTWLLLLAPRSQVHGTPVITHTHTNTQTRCLYHRVLHCFKPVVAPSRFTRSSQPIHAQPAALIMLALRLTARTAVRNMHTARPIAASIITTTLRGYRAASTKASAAKPKRVVKKSAAAATAGKEKPKRAAKKTTKSTAAAKKPVKAVDAEKAAERAEKAAERAVRKKAKEAKDEIKALKELALSPPSSRPISSWTIFVADAAKTKPRGDGDLSTYLKQLSEDYKSLSEQEKQRFDRLTAEHNEKSKNDFEEWLQSQTPAAIHKANAARRQLRAKVADSKGKYVAIKDDRLVKRPMSPYLMYLTQRYESGGFRGVSIVEAGKNIATEWKALSSGEVQVRFPSWPLLCSALPCC
jgi:hypothetical protein